VLMELDKLIQHTGGLEISSKKRKLQEDFESPIPTKLIKNLSSPTKNLKNGLSNVFNSKEERYSSTKFECNHFCGHDDRNSFGPFHYVNNPMDSLYIVKTDDFDVRLGSLSLRKGTVIQEKEWTLNSKTGIAEKQFQIVPNGSKGLLTTQASNGNSTKDSFLIVLELCEKLLLCYTCKRWTL